MQFFVRSVVVSGLLALGVDLEDMNICWDKWESENAVTPLDSITPEQFARSLVSAAEAAGS